MALTDAEKEVLRGIISAGNPLIRQKLAKYAAMSDDDIRVEIVKGQTVRLDQLIKQKEIIDSQIADLESQAVKP